MAAGAEFSNTARTRKLVNAWRLLDAGFLYGAASLVRKERERAMTEQAEEDLRAIEQLTEQMRARLSGERLAQFDEWVAAESYIVPPDRSPEFVRSELSRIGLALAVATALLVLAAFLLPDGPTVAVAIGLFLALGVLPIYVAHRLGEARGRRDQWMWAIFLGWIGVLIVVLRPRKRPLAGS